MSTPDPFTPTVADVAALIRARTKDSNGNEAGTFTSQTRPTDVQVEEAIAHAVAGLHEKVGTIGDACADIARTAAMYAAAAEIELSYLPEQARTDRSPYTFLNNRYEQLLTGVQECVLGNRPSNDPSGDVIGGPAQMGTLRATSAAVNDYYTGQRWPLLTPPPPTTP